MRSTRSADDQPLHSSRCIDSVALTASSCGGYRSGCRRARRRTGSARCFGGSWTTCQCCWVRTRSFSGRTQHRSTRGEATAAAARAVSRGELNATLLLPGTASQAMCRCVGYRRLPRACDVDAAARHAGIGRGGGGAFKIMSIASARHAGGSGAPHPQQQQHYHRTTTTSTTTSVTVTRPPAHLLCCMLCYAMLCYVMLCYAVSPARRARLRWSASTIGSTM